MKRTPIPYVTRLTGRPKVPAEAAEKSSFTATLTRIGEFAYKLLLVMGIASTVAYLLYSIHYFPAGVTIGDSLFFLLVAAAFGLGYLVFLGAGFLLAYGLASLWGAWNGLGERLVWLLAGVAALLFLLCASDPLAADMMRGIAGFTAAGWALYTLILRLDQPRRRHQGAIIYYWFLWGVLFLGPLIMAPGFLARMNENYVMRSAGLRAVDVTLKLSEENYDIVSRAASGQHLALLGCNGTAGTPERLVHGVNLLWHGMGERSLVEIPDHQGRRLIVELKREGVFVFRDYAGDVERCLELDGDVFFKTGAAVLAATDSRDFKEMMKVIRENQAFVEEIRVIGHADAKGYPGGAELNNTLALQRAQAIEAQIRAGLSAGTASQPPLAIPVIYSQGHGAREPKTLCKDWPVKATLAECLAINRRVEVRMKFQPRVTQDICAPSQAAGQSPPCWCRLLRRSPATAAPSSTPPSARR